MVQYRFSVSPDPPLILRGDSFSLHIVGLPFGEDVTHVWVDLARVEWEETSWSWNSGVKPAHQDGGLKVSFARLDVDPGIYLVSRLRFSLESPPDPSRVIDARPTANFPRTILQVTDQLVTPAPAGEIAERVRAMEEAREALFRSGIMADPANPGIGRFRGFAFVTRCLLTRRMRLDRLEVFPLKRGVQSLEHAVVINKILTQSGCPPLVDVEGRWARISEQAFPMIVVHTPLIYGRNHADAMSALERHAQAVVDVLAPHRMSYGEIFALVLVSLDFPGQGWYRPAFEGYRGNTVGGFISGEEPKALKNDVWNVLADPMLRLFVSLYREAAAETNLDFAYFRFWNLLEAIATRRIPKVDISTFDGQPIVGPNNEPVNTSGHGAAGVYELIKRHFVAKGSRANLILEGLRLPDLWTVCQVWLGYRNATGHYGGFVAGDPHQSQQGWYRLTSQAYAEAMAEGAGRDLSSDRYFVALAETARLIVIWEIKKPPRNPRATRQAALAQ